MLDLILGLGSLAIKAGSALGHAKAQNKAAAANKVNAEAALTDQLNSLTLRQTQEQDATQQTIQQITREAQHRDALARVSAGEAGVAGASVDALLSDLDFSSLRAKQTEEQNLNMREDRLNAERRSAFTLAKNRINAVPSANPFETGLTIAGAGLEFANSRIKFNPPGA